MLGWFTVYLVLFGFPFRVFVLFGCDIVLICFCLWLFFDLFCDWFNLVWVLVVLCFSLVCLFFWLGLLIYLVVGGLVGWVGGLLVACCLVLCWLVVVVFTG